MVDHNAIRRTGKGTRAYRWSKVVVVNNNMQHFKSETSYLAVANLKGEKINLPVYMLLLSEDLLSSLPNQDTRYGEHLKIASEHGLRKFRIWFYDREFACRVRIEEFQRASQTWEVIHTYRAL